MPIVLTVKKTKKIDETNVESSNVSDLYKLLGYKSADKMKSANAIWSEGDKRVHVYGKTTGRAGSENQFEFPPPIDNILFFGNVYIVLVSISGDSEKIVDLTSKTWDGIYERLFGGFEDLVDSDGNTLDDSEEESEDDLEGLKLTKDGYVKDDFVVDDDEIEDIEDEEYEPVPKKKVISVKVKKESKIKEPKIKEPKIKEPKIKEPKIKEPIVKEEVKKEAKIKESKPKKEAKEPIVKEEVKKEQKKEPKKEVKEKEPKPKKEVKEPKEKKERKKKVLPSLESAIFDDQDNLEENDTLGRVSEELAEEEYV